MTRLLAWVDLETTGLEVPVDEVCEIAFVVTDEKLIEVDSWESTIVISADGWDRLVDDEVVFQMHRASGLLSAMQESFRTIRDVDSIVSQRFRAATERFGVDELTLAGSGVAHFDSQLIRRHLPGIDRMLHWRPLDIGVLREWGKLCGMEPAPTSRDKPHRALADIRLCLDEARWYRARDVGRG
jgi:oligoribonuclease